ncbi:MAG: hypothetical protein ABJP70_04460 [Erythrobacter sp.]
MTDEPREIISVISETSVSTGLVRFVDAFFCGTAVGTAALCLSLLLLSDLGALPSDLSDLIEGILLIGFIVGLFTLAGMVVIGLPVTLMLRLLGHERWEVYATLGGGSGMLVLALLMGAPTVLMPGAFLLPISGALAGLASALRWGTWRERAARERERERLDHPSDKRDNPIHDLTH